VRASQALAVLNETIDGNRIPRKALADEIGVTEQTFSKMAAGTQAFGIDAVGRLPRDVQVAFWKRYGKDVLGLEVREITNTELAQDIVDGFHELFKRIERAELLGAVTLKQVKSDLPAREPARKAGAA
jgi:hypothetical protein